MQPNKPSQLWPVTRLVVNGRTVDVTAPADMPLLWALRDVLALTGTKFGCGIGQCGACTVHLDGDPVRSCVLPISAVKGEIAGQRGREGVDCVVAGQRSKRRHRPPHFRGHMRQLPWLERKRPADRACGPSRLARR
jgi:hypothetical protein